MALTERLGYKSLRELYANLDNNEIMEWAAYDKLQDEDWVKQVKKVNNLENQKTQTPEEEAEKMKAMLMSIGK